MAAEGLTNRDSDVSDDDSVQEDFPGEFDEYNGYKPAPGINYITHRVSRDIPPCDFFEQYICQRRPAVIAGLPKDDNWRGHLWTNSYLCEKAASANVLVEDRQRAQGEGYLSFGTSAPKVEMDYGQFINAISKDETRFYLTTQDLERFDCDEFNLPKSFTAEPLCSLSGDYPIQPAILGNLIPHQISLWQGSSEKGHGSSTGLHHDFHDNLYILLRGRKRFRLFPPSSALLLQTVGQPTKIHRNGLIVHPLPGYKSHGVAVRADGVPLAVIARRKRDLAEQQLAEAEERLMKLQESEDTDQVKLEAAEQAVEDCEQQLDFALQQLLRYSEGSEDLSSVDDGSLAVESSDSEQEPVAKQPRVTETCQDSSEARHSTVLCTKLPDHFCNIQLPSDDVIDPNVLFSQVTQPGDVRCLIADLHAGEMLYLPASWFHEVTSYNDETGLTQDADFAGHLALNYWMYPPDGDKFQQPYIDDFWPQRWTKIREEKLTASSKD